LNIDLHIHTKASDGTMTPSEVVAEAASRGLTVISITDHDTTDGLEEAIEAGRRHGIVVIPGVEISSADPREEVHLLGYYMDYHAAQFQAFLEAPRVSRVARIRRMCERLAACGVQVSPDEVLEEAGGSDSVGRPHLARVMVKKGYVSSMDEAFERFLGDGAPGYVKRSKNSVDETIEAIHRHGGISVIAHPGLFKNQDMVGHLIAKGVMGIEAYCHEHTTDMVERYLEIAAKAKLLVTGGSDYHGAMLEKSFRLGDLEVPERCYWALEGAYRGMARRRGMCCPTLER
jgi:predicted metal-dependent phosphoesterase TrpH